MNWPHSLTYLSSTVLPEVYKISMHISLVLISVFLGCTTFSDNGNCNCKSKVASRLSQTSVGMWTLK